MIRALHLVFSILIGSSYGIAQSTATREFRISNLEELLAVQPEVGPGAIETDGAIVIRLAAGTYRLEDSFRITRSRVSLIGEPGTRLVLADGVNEPVLAIGSQVEFPTVTDRIESILLAGLEIEGNRANQASETSIVRPWIRNNGIDVRAVHHLMIDDVTANRNRSGGLVISWDSSDVLVVRSTFLDNFFDGVAYYASEGIVTRDSVMSDNGYAGVSLDNRVVDCRFEACRIESNGAVGVFARNSTGLRFENCVIEDSGDWGIFLAHDEKNLGVHDTEISVCQIARNRGGVYVASPDESQSSGTRVVSSAFGGNMRDGRRNIQTAGSAIWTMGIVELPGTVVASGR